MGRGHPINEGDKPKLEENETYFRHGMGCKLWKDCFSCPYPDCSVGHEKFLTNNTVIARG